MGNGDRYKVSVINQGEKKACGNGGWRVGDFTMEANWVKTIEGVLENSGGFVSTEIPA